MAKGKIQKLFADRGFGFIRPEAGGKDVHFRPSAVKGDLRFNQLSEGMEVEYEARPGDRGPQAIWVSALGTQPSLQASSAPSRSQQPRGASSVMSGYRFLNPYNFVRFLPAIKSQTRTVIEGQSFSALGEAFLAAGLKAEVEQTSEALRVETQLLGRCAPPPHDRYVGLSGKIVCNLEAVTPLFVSDSHGVQLRGEHKSYEFFKIGGEHALPATSLRGMVRSVFEAVTNSCVAWLTDARLSYHLDAADATKLVPARVEIDNDGNLSLRLLTGTTPLNPGERPGKNQPQYAAWILRYLPPLRISQNIPGGTPYGKRRIVNLNGYAHRSQCWALLKLYEHPRRGFKFWNVERLADIDKRAELPAQVSNDERVVEGYLCINNQNIENKHDERFFFFEPGLNNADVIPLGKIDAETEAKRICKDYEVLVKDYQQRHRDKVKKLKRPEEPAGKKAAYSRFIVNEEEAKLRDDDLVYAFLTSQKKVQFIVPVSVPRVAYKNSISKLLPDDANLNACRTSQSLCPACRVFGWVHENPGKEVEQVAYAGRVRFSHGRLINDAGTLSPVPLAILSSPKPTTTRFYLKPKEGGIPSEWTGDSAKEAYDKKNVLRGRKLYRHHGIAREEEYRRAGDRCDDQNRTVRDALKPGALFNFSVHFENLAPVELGALLWSLEMDRQCVHRLGFAKPLGFGSVRINVDSVMTLDPARRYNSLEDDGWQQHADWQKEYVEMLKRELESCYPAGDFENLDNVRDLRALLGDQTPILPIHYPRTDRVPDPEGRNFEWFMGNNRYAGYTLGPADADQGLPLLSRDGPNGRLRRS